MDERSRLPSLNLGVREDGQDMSSAGRVSVVRSQGAIVGLAALASVALLWTVPAVGFVAVAVLLVLIAPWGSFLAERMVISGIVVLAVIAVVFPRASTVPITAESTRLLLSVVVAVFIVGSFARAWRGAGPARLIPKVGWLDALVLLVLAIGLWWPISTYIGGSPQQIVSALFYGGWDNAAHFLTFANTYEQHQTLWTTVDGSVAWNQWYPSLQTTAYAVLQQAAGIGGLSREGLLLPYAVWTSASFAASIAAVTWVAGDLARRWLAPQTSTRWSIVGASAAAIMTGSWALLGSPQFLLNSGFLNFLMGVALVVVASYLASRSWASARAHGWYVIPLAAISVIGLWTPLVLFLVPAGVVVLVALWRWRRAWAVVWVVVNVVIGGWLAWVQLDAILFALDDSTVGEFSEHIGRVGTGMAPFNLGAALAAPIIGVAAAILVRRSWPLPVAVAVPGVAGLAIAGFFAVGSNAAGTSLLRSYYVLKALDAALIGTAPVIAAAIATVTVLTVRHLSRVSIVAVGVIGGVLTLAAFGYVGAAPQGMSPGFSPAPGVQASWVRANGMQDSLIGESILAGVRGARLAPDSWPVLWDGSGQLPNLWVAALAGTMSAPQSTFYFDIGNFPYGEEAASVIRDRAASDEDVRIAVIWYRGASGEFLRPRLSTVDPRRLQLIQETVTSTALCEDCAVR